MPVIVMQSYELTSDMDLTTIWIKEGLGSFQDEEEQNFFTNADLNSAVSFECEPASRPQKKRVFFLNYRQCSW